MVRFVPTNRPCRYPPAIKRPALRIGTAGWLTAQDDVDAATPTVATMGPSDGRYPLPVARCCEPVVDRRADSPALHGRIAGPGMAGDQQQHPLVVNDRLLQGPVDRLPGAIEVVAMEVDDAVRLHRACAKPPVPAGIEGIGDRRPAGPWRRSWPRRRAFWLVWDWGRCRPCRRSGRFRLRRRLATDRLPRKGPDGCGHSRPQGLLLRGEAAHAMPRSAQCSLWAAGPATCR